MAEIFVVGDKWTMNTVHKTSIRPNVRKVTFFMSFSCWYAQCWCEWDSLLSLHGMEKCFIRVKQGPFDRVLRLLSVRNPSLGHRSSVAPSLKLLLDPGTMKRFVDAIHRFKSDETQMRLDICYYSYSSLCLYK